MKHNKRCITIFFWLIVSIVIFTSSNAQPVLPSSLTLTSQSSVDYWGDFFDTYGYTIIGGHLSIQNSSITDPDPITDLTPIDAITSVQGDLVIYDNDVLTTLTGLENITSVSGQLYILLNSLLANLNGLGSITSVGTDILIQQNDALTDIAGLGSITSVNGNLQISGSAVLTNLGGLENITSVGGNFAISMNSVLTNLNGLESLTSVGGGIEISNNIALTDLDGLESLSSVGGDFNVQSNAVLTNLDGLAILSSIGNDLQISNNALLTNLDGLESLTSVVGQDLIIVNNPALVSFCGLYPLLNTGGTFYVSIYGNDANPTVAQIIAGGPCVPLPVELISFTASIKNSIVELHWQTATEVNNYGFEILRCSHNTNWLKIGFVEGYGNSNSPKYYSFTDKYPSGDYNFKYKLKQIDNDGTFEYSKTIEIYVGVPLDFELSQNYPNPFNPVTTIKYSIPIKSQVEIVIYNTLGEKVKQLVNEEKPEGTYEVVFNSHSGEVRNLTSGVYFYQLKAGNFIDTKKMMLMK